MRVSHWRLITALLVIFNLVGSGSRAEVRPAWVDPQLLGENESSPTLDFLVVLRAQAELDPVELAGLGFQKRGEQVVDRLSHTALRTQAPLLAELEELGAEYQPYWITNLIRVRGDRRALLAMSAHPAVLSIVSNAPFRAALAEPVIEPAQVPQGVEWNVDRVGASALWNLGVTGQGIIYAVADTGVDWDHPALISNYRGWDGENADHNFNWWDAVHADLGEPGSNRCGNDFSSPVPCDDLGHGTHVLGTGVGGDGGDNQIGVAPGAEWIACRNMENNFGTPATYIECLEFFLAPWDLERKNQDPNKRPHVISNSYSCTIAEGCTPQTIDVLRSAVEAVTAAGIFMAVSAGNLRPSDCGTINEPPAIERASFTIGATDRFDVIADFSRRGPVIVGDSLLRKPDLVAPGVGVRSSIPPQGNLPALYGLKSGTSMAAPHAAGAVALLWSAFPDLRGDVAETRLLLESSAWQRTTSETCGGDKVTSVPNNVYGYGLLNVLAAYGQRLPERYYLPSVFK